MMPDLFLGNLSNSIPVENLLDHIVQLFCILDFHIKPKQCTIKRKKNKTFAFIDLSTDKDVNYALDHLKTWKSRKQIRFNFNHLTDNGQSLKAHYRYLTSGKPKRNKIGGIVENSNHEVETYIDGLQVNDKSKKNKDIEDFQIDAATSISGLHGQQEKKTQLSMPDKPSKNDNDLYFIQGEKIGCETRSKEFKMYSGIEHVGKYVCGFLNSMEDGQFLIGIRDDGTVVGLECNQKQEDNYRLRIDHCIKEMCPAVLPDRYTVEFIPVLLQGAKMFTNKKVLTITVHSIEIDTLYATRMGVFLRRDASLQGPLCDADIQQWHKQKHQAEVRQYKDQQIFLMEQVQEKQILMEQVQEKQDKIESLEKTNKAGGRKPSKICCIM